MKLKEVFLIGFETGFKLASEYSGDSDDDLMKIIGEKKRMNKISKKLFGKKKGKRGGKMTSWTEEEDAILRANLDTKPRFVVQYIPSRTPLAISARMMLMKKGKLKKRAEQFDKYEGLAKLGQDLE